MSSRNKALNGVVADATDVKASARRGIFIMMRPAHKIFHNGIIVDFIILQAIEGGERHAGIVRPCALGDRISTPSLHIRYGMFIKCLTRGKFNRDTEGIADGKPEHQSAQVGQIFVLGKFAEFTFPTHLPRKIVRRFDIYDFAFLSHFQVPLSNRLH